jgi:hypothetical protein
MFWQLHQMATTYRVRPSDFLDLSSSWDAFCVDRATFMYGTALSAELEEAGSNPKIKNKRSAERARQQVLDRWFPEARTKKKFADPGKRN